MKQTNDEIIEGSFHEHFSEKIEGSEKPLLNMTGNLKDVIKANYKKKIALMF